LFVTRTTDLAATAAAPGLVERHEEMAELLGALDAVCEVRPRVLLLAGEPGIGKTRLAQETAAQAAARGFRVAWGRCWENAGAPSYWPWTQILRALLRAEPAAPAPALAARRPLLAQIVPGEHGRSSADKAAVPEVLDGPAARFSLFDVVTEGLREEASRVPLLLVLDDLHAADEASLRLLEFVAGNLQAARLLIVATYRVIEVRRDVQRADLFGTIQRHATNIPVAGLSAAGVGHLLHASLRTPLSAELVQAVYAATEGNPFFVDEIARLLASRVRAEPRVVLRPADIRIPQGVRAAIGERLRLLSPACRDVMRVAAAIGRDVEVGLLQQACEIPLSELLERLAEAGAAGAMEAAIGNVESYRFAHALIRDVLYEEIPLAARPRLHQRLAAAMERLGEIHSEAEVGELARHYRQAAACGTAAKAIEYAVRAAETAAARMAYEDAASHYERALAALRHLDGANVALRCELLLGLGSVQRASGNRETQATFEAAAAIARAALTTTAAPFASLLARAALGFADHALGLPIMVSDARTVELLEEALRHLPPTDSDLRARLLGRLSMETSAAYDRRRSDALSREGVDMARRVGTATTLATTLSYRHFVLWRLDYLADRLGIAAEIVQLAEQEQHKELALQGRSWRVIDLIGVGNGDLFDRELAAQARAAEELRQPRYRWMTLTLRALRALWRGNWEEAEELAQAGMAIGQATGEPTTANTAAAQMLLIRREQGRLDEVEGLHRFMAERFTDSPAPRVTLALIYSDLGREDDARRELEQVASDDFARLRHEQRIGVLPFLAEVCAYLGDAHRAALLNELLQPYARCNVPYGAAASFGSGAHYLGLLATAMREWDTAERYFEDAVAHNRQLQGRAWVARSLYAYAHMLRQRDRGRAGTAGSADTLLDEAEKIAAEHKMVQLGRQIEQLRGATARAATTRAATLEPVPAGATAFRLEGSMWCVGDEAKSPWHLKDSKGARYLAHLLRNPGHEVHAIELSRLDVSDEDREAIGAANGLGMPMLDARAKTEYRRRLAALREQHEEASSFNDAGRAARLQEEIDILAQELARALGLHGRQRTAGSFAEKARLNVTRAVKSVIRRIAAVDPTLGRYLETTVRTGTFCSYTPDPRLPVVWHF